MNLLKCKVMSTQTDSLAQLLSPFGLLPEEARVYLFLLENEFLSALLLSRKLRMGRTKVYRILDKLTEKGLVNRKLDDMGLKFGANSYKQLELLVNQKEEELVTLKKTASTVFEQLAAITAQASGKSKVLYYSGKDGLKQVTINTLRARERLFIYEVGQDMTGFIEPHESEKIREELVAERISTYQLTNAKEIKPYTKVKELVRKHWECRYISPDDLDIEFEVVIYNDVYVLYTFHEQDVFCVEIYNEQLARMQKQIFQYLWARSKKLTILNNEGWAKVE